MGMLVRVLVALSLLTIGSAAAAQPLPRTADGKPNLEGIWQAHNRAAYGLLHHVARFRMPAGASVVAGDEIPYQPWALEQQRKNFAERATADPLEQCYLPGVPRIMYMEFPFQIFQTGDHVAMTFEWSQVHRLIYTNGQATLHEGIESWMGNSRGRWEGDTLVVEVTDHNDRAWLDAAGNFHSAAGREHDRLRGHARGSERVHAAVDDPRAAASADGSRSPVRIPMPSGEGRRERRVRARRAHLVSRGAATR
jgi:hypothetical protein